MLKSFLKRVRGPELKTAWDPEVERLISKLSSLKMGRSPHTILVSSALAAEGKSTVSSLIAASIARNQGQTTLLIDLDLRWPSLHEMFNVNIRGGVSDVLSEAQSLRSCLRKTEVPELWLLTAGRQMNSPDKLYKPHNLENLMRQISELAFETVVFDTPPAICVSDPLRFGQYADTIALVAKAGGTPKHIIRQAVHMFHDVGLTVDGMILNNMDQVLPHYRNRTYYGKQYVSGGQQSVKDRHFAEETYNGFSHD